MVTDPICEEVVNLLVRIVDHLNQGIVVFVQDAMMHHRLFVVLEIELMLKPEQVLYE